MLNFYDKTGGTFVHSWHAENKEFTVSWNNVFISQYPLFYEVTIGTTEGGSEILQWQETKLPTLKFGLPPTMTNIIKFTLHLSIRAINAGGTYEDIKFVILHE